MKGYPLIKLLSRSLDRSYLWWTLEKSRTDHRPSHYEFSRFTVGDYLDSPELFYPMPKGVTEMRFMETKRTAGIVWEGIATRDIKKTDAEGGDQPGTVEPTMGGH